MIPPELIEQIREDSFLKYILKPVLRFDNYLDETNLMSIKIRGFRSGQYDDDNEPIDPVPVDEDFEYTHRWTKRYDHRILCKLYNLQYYYVANPSKMPKYTMMVTLTGSHASPRAPTKLGLRHMPYLVKFHEAHRKEKDMFKQYLKTVDYLSILEGHPESGYVHAHDNYFLDKLPSEKTLNIIENYWNNTQKMGSSKHGIKIEIKEPKDFHDMKSFIAYPLSYLGKTTIGALSEWTKYDVVFNTCLWLSGKSKIRGGLGKRIRAFQPSRSLSKIMSRKYFESGEVKSNVNSNFYHIETFINRQGVLNSAFRNNNYDERMKVWTMFGGDDEQYVSLADFHTAKKTF